MKIIALTTMGIAFALLGQYMAFRLNMRAKLLEKLQIMIGIIESEINYLRLPSDCIVNSLIGKDEISELKFLKECDKYIKNGYDFRQAWEKALSEKQNVRYFQKEDVSMIKSFVSSFGTTDSEGQISNCNLHSELLKERLVEAREMKKRYAALSSGLGIIAGIGIIVIFI